MYFLDEDGERVNNCLSCGADFSRKKIVVLNSANCSFSCSAKQLEIYHEKVALQMVVHCFGKKGIKVVFPKDTAITDETLKWGWTDDVRMAILIPWYTLRSKKEFFETMAHEMGHIAAYWKLFKTSERKVVYNFDTLRLRYKIFRSPLTETQLGRYYIENKEIVDRYQSWEGHEYEPWYPQYRKFHKKLINSPFKKYAYGNEKPLQYGFNEKGEGEYKPRKMPK